MQSYSYRLVGLKVLHCFVVIFDMFHEELWVSETLVFLVPQDLFDSYKCLVELKSFNV